MPEIRLEFTVGDVFDPEDRVSLWMCVVGMAFNDLITTHVRADEATEDWEVLYFSRVGIGHYSEIMLFLEAQGCEPAIREFIMSLPQSLQEDYESTLTLYDANRGLAKRLRNQAIFHYPDKRGIVAMRRALRDPIIKESRSGVTSRSGSLRESRLHYADEVMAKMVVDTGGETFATIERVFGELAAGVTAFMRFANAVQDEFFLRRGDSVTVTRQDVE